MLFKHPQLLYALFLLIIPIIVHLFQLRRFKKEYFTNVKFLKKVQLETRKSSQVKKWLTLLARLLALACLIIAFAQPYFPETSQTLQEKETVIYLDNSFSMQQKGAQGELLKKAVQDLLTEIPENYSFSLLTNDEVYKNTTKQELTEELQQINYSATSSNFKTNYLRAQNLFSEKADVLKKFVAISDFQQQNVKDLNFNAEIENTIIQLKPESNFNVSIDSVFVKEKTIENTELQVNISAATTTEELFTVSLYNRENLMAKSSVSFAENKNATTSFSVPTNENIEGILQVNDNSLQFDNRLYFSLQQNEKIKVAAISDADDAFLKKIYTETEFELNLINSDQLNYNELSEQNLIILNELKTIPQGLSTILNEHIENGGMLAIIPSVEINQSSYQQLFSSLNLSSLQQKQEEELKITNINFSHPLYQNVFNKQIKNFDYPKVNTYYTTTNAGDQILNYNNGQAFLKKIGNSYVFSSAIDQENSNFKNSPLIVPTFYNIAKQSLQLPQLYYTNQGQNTIEINANLNEDEVVKVRDSSQSFIPLQQRFANKVRLTLQDEPKTAGNYNLVAKENNLKQVSFNYSRAESKLIFTDFSDYKNITQQDSITNFFTQEINANQMNFLWKWFVIFALLFLVIEFLLLKFLK